MDKGKEFWRKHVEASGPKGARVAEYAQAHGLKLSTLRWWRSQLLRDDVAAVARPDSRFVAVRVTPSVVPSVAPSVAPTAAPEAVTVRIGGQVRIELACLPSPQWLAMLAQAAQEGR